MRRLFSYLLSLALLLSLHQPGTAQERREAAPFLLNLFKQNRLLPETRAAATDKPSVIANMNAHREAYLDLRARGKTPETIDAILNSKRSHAGSGSIAGTLYESDGLTPLQGLISVRAYDEFGAFAGSVLVFSRGDGLYAIEDLAAGRYLVVAAEFSTTYRMQYYNKVEDWRDAALVEVFEGQQTPGIDFALEKFVNYPSGSGAITGIVTDDQNQPIAGEAIIDALDENLLFVTSSRVDSSGHYLINGLGTGSYKLRASYIGQGNVLNEWYNNARRADEADSVQVVDADTTANVDFILDAGGTINVKIFTPDGQMLTDLEAGISIFDVNLQFVNATGRFIADEFIISRLESGTYFLSASYFGSENYLETWFGNAADISDAVPVVVSAPDTTKDLSITLIRGGEIQGTVTYPGEALSANEVLITAFDEQGLSHHSAAIRADGTYAISYLRPGRYKLFVEYYGILPPNRLPAFQWFNDAADFNEARIVEVPETPLVARADFVLKRGGLITGQVLASNGQPFGATGTVSCYTLEGDRVARGNFGFNGVYVVGGLRTGEYKLLMTLNNADDFSPEWYDSQLAFENATPVTLTSPNTTYPINFTPELKKRISGFVGTTAGQPLTAEAAFLQVYAVEANTGNYFSFTGNSFNSGFTLRVLNGEYKVAAVSVYSNDDSRQDSLAATWATTGAGIDDPNTQKFAFTENQSFIPTAITMPKTSGGIAGTIFAGSPPRPVTQQSYLLFAFDALGYLVKVSRYSPSSNPVDGSYLLTGLRPGKYFILAALFRSESFDDVDFLWLGGVVSDLTVIDFKPHVEIPVGATAVEVNESLVSGNDIFYDLVTGIEARDAGEVVSTYRLLQNYPNPFSAGTHGTAGNPTTTIAYELPQQSRVTISIFDLTGRLVETLVNQTQTAGRHVTHWLADGMPAGIYFIRMQADEFVQTRKSVLVR